MTPGMACMVLVGLSSPPPLLVSSPPPPPPLLLLLHRGPPLPCGGGCAGALSAETTRCDGREAGEMTEGFIDLIDSVSFRASTDWVNKPRRY